jgi:hypothetical protein
MSGYSERDTYSQAGDWLLGTVRRNPEALLLMAAGCCLMMRSGSASRTNLARQHPLAAKISSPSTLTGCSAPSAGPMPISNILAQRRRVSC